MSKWNEIVVDQKEVKFNRLRQRVLGRRFDDPDLYYAATFLLRNVDMPLFKWYAGRIARGQRAHSWLRYWFEELKDFDRRDAEEALLSLLCACYIS